MAMKIGGFEELVLLIVGALKEDARRKNGQ
ncbi:MAG: hypothetical protein ACI9A7_001996 [Cyclobacteriaceae bacterium]|jgi:hypothetical protein